MPKPSSDAPIALISGAARGLGFAAVERLQEEGWQVHGVVRSSAGRAELEARLGTARVHRADLSQEGAAIELVERVLALDGRLNGIVHAVGPFANAPASATSRQQVLDLMTSNLVSAVDFLAAAREPLRQAKGAAVLFGAAGLEGCRGRQGTAAYTAAKTALLVWMRSVALEEAPYGVRINMVSPGVVPHEHAAPESHDPDRLARIPAGRGGTPGEVAGAVSWLLSPDAGYVVGQNLEVAGGWLL